MKAETDPSLDGVVLVRLLVRPEKFTVSQLARSLQSLLAIDITQARQATTASLARLKERGLIWPDTKLMLNDDGERAALEELGYSALPRRQKRLDWKWAKKALLARRLKASGFTSDAGASALVAAWFLAQKHELDLPRKDGPKQEPSPDRVVRALARRAMGLPDAGPLDSDTLLRALFGLAAGPASQAAAAQPTKAALPAAPPQPDHEPPRPAATMDDLPTFAREVNEAARSAREGRWVGDKVFIAQVWKDYNRGRPNGGLPLDAFKQRLTEAAREGKVLLSRADLIGAYPQEEMRLSQIDVGGELYHFLETQHLG